MATQWIQIDARKLSKNICRFCGGMMKFGGYSFGSEQIDDEILERKFSISPKFYYQHIGQKV